MNWYLDVLKKYATFSGRARRKEYWYFILFNMIVCALLSVIDRSIGTCSDSGIGYLSGIYSVATLIPNIAVSVRRLHDTGRSGWWLLVSLVPVLGSLALVFFLVQNSKSGANQYGPDPKGISA